MTKFIQLLLPAAVLAFVASSALADPRDDLSMNHVQRGSIGQSSWPGPVVPQSIKHRDTDAKAFLEGLSPRALAGMARSNEVAREKEQQNEAKANGGPPVSTRKIAHPRGGEQTSESPSGVASKCSSTHRCAKEGERLHLSGAELQQLSGGGEKPADTGESHGSRTPAPTGQAQPPAKAAPTASTTPAVSLHHSSEKLRTPVHRIQEEKPGDMPTADNRPIHSAIEGRTDRFMSQPAAGSMTLNRIDRQVQMQMPEKFYH